MSVGFEEFDEEKERARFRKMNDNDLIREGKAARFLCSSKQNFGLPPRLKQHSYVAPLPSKENCHNLLPFRGEGSRRS